MKRYIILCIAIFLIFNLCYSIWYYSTFSYEPIMRHRHHSDLVQFRASVLCLFVLKNILVSCHKLWCAHYNKSSFMSPKVQSCPSNATNHSLDLSTCKPKLSMLKQVLRLYPLSCFGDNLVTQTHTLNSKPFLIISRSSFTL